MIAWAKGVLACPRCGGRLFGFGANAQVVRCADCGPYPVLAGVPILVPEPATWCAQHYDAALSTLAEHQRVSPKSVQTLRAFADVASDVTPAAFSDDWTTWEALRSKPPVPVEGPGGEALNELIRIAGAQSPSGWLAHRTSPGLVMEVGCGAGRTAELLATRGRKLVVADVSLRAVMEAHARSGAVPVVADAQALPVKARSLDAVVAENVVDLLNDAEAFFSSAALALKPKGRLLLSTPGPELGAPDGDASQLDRIAARAGLVVKESIDGLPWLRRNSSRFLEVWLVRAAVLAHGR